MANRLVNRDPEMTDDCAARCGVDRAGLTVYRWAPMEQLRPDWSALRHLQQMDERASEQALRNFIGGFGFDAERALSQSRLSTAAKSATGAGAADLAKT
ncbi:MAG: hypothetical protein U5O69_10120 [Candidatus Competibacteraceae bacterium]|nr:hypothetical protein [Candidatus Competibacteraceae bacterium]